MTRKETHKVAEEIGEFLGKKIADKIETPKLCLMIIQEMLKK